MQELETVKPDGQFPGREAGPGQSMLVKPDQVFPPVTDGHKLQLHPGQVGLVKQLCMAQNPVAHVAYTQLDMGCEAGIRCGRPALMWWNSLGSHTPSAF